MQIEMVARHVDEIPFAGIRKVFNKANHLEAQGTRVIHFEIGRPDFDTPNHIKQAAAQALEKGMVHYTPNVGVLGLREALAESIALHKGISYDPESEIMATAGGQESMYLGLQTFLNPGDEVLVPNPGYSQFYSCTKLVGGVPVAVPLREDQGFIPDLEAAANLLTERTRAIVVNSPHNPTGAVLDAAQMEAICRFAVDHELLLFSDEAYDRILYGGSKFVSPAAIADMKERTVIWGSLSKTYAMTGWRIGYLAGPKELLRAAVKVQQTVILSICSFAQAGAIAALRGSQDCVDAMVAEFDKRRRVILDGIEQTPGLACPVAPSGAFYFFIKHDVPNMDSAALADHLLEKGGVALVPGSAFGSNGEGYLRLSYATSLEDCREGMERIGSLMKERVG